ncbi:MAG: helix-turn-helix domain-containing protein, partial [Tunicatimonas sp.]|uniref:helix-turn-helix domain-containing protein n=1 Tax=Tunicatimonas sp. TaxID=1940096 RepID=UPI003C75A2F7
HYPTPTIDPVDAIQVALEERGMIQQDLVPTVGPKSRVSEIMNRKRKPTVNEIKALHEYLNIPLEIFFA